jgi:putative ABC transport system permease protein
LLLLVSLGLGTFLMMTLYLSRDTLLGQLRVVGGDDRPNLMLFDIQDDQAEPREKTPRGPRRAGAASTRPS